MNALTTADALTRWRARPLIRAMFLAAIGGLFSSAAIADPPAMASRLSWVTGEVTLRQATDAPTHPARRGWELTVGSVLATGPMGRAEVSLGGTTLLVDVNSEVQITAIDQQRLRLHLNRSSVAMRLATPEAVRGSSVDTAWASSWRATLASSASTRGAVR